MPTGQYLDIFSGAELDRLNRHPLGILNGSHIEPRAYNPEEDEVEPNMVSFQEIVRLIASTLDRFH